MKHSSSFFHDLRFGEEAEDWAKKLLGGGFKVEVKRDRKAGKTGNLYIEYQSRGKPSGIATTEADYWIYCIDGSGLSFIISTETLKKITRDKMGTKGGDNNSSLGVLIPITDLIKTKYEA